MYFVLKLVIQMISILIVSYLFPDWIWVDHFWAALVAAFILGIVNAVLRPVLVFLTLPITLLTFGLFLLVINGLMLWLVSALVKGFHVEGFWAALMGSILISVVSWILSRGVPR
ncbi:MAG: phage holin family protein [Desulfobacterota bacterium]|nr:phage holin family protein [Thermodesulfobacteriota bacterium]